MNKEQIILELANKKIKQILDSKDLILLTPDVCKRYFLLGNGLVYTTKDLYCSQENEYKVSNFVLGKGDVISKDYVERKTYILNNWIPGGRHVKDEFSTDIKSKKHDFYKIIRASCQCVTKGEFTVEESTIFLEPGIKDFTSPETFDSFKDLYSFTKL
jgi:hypothetical protein